MRIVDQPKTVSTRGCEKIDLRILICCMYVHMNSMINVKDDLSLLLLPPLVYEQWVMTDVLKIGVCLVVSV